MRSRWTTLASGALAATTAVLAALSLPACNTEKPAAVRTCCDQPRIPPGVASFVVVTDDVTGPTDGQEVKMRVALKQKTRREAIYPALHFLYRYAMTRDTFEPVSFVGELYPSEGEAKMGGNPIAKVWRDRSDRGPKCENTVRLDFSEEVDRAFLLSTNRGEAEDLADSCHLTEKKVVPRFDAAFKHKPAFTVDAATKSAEVTFPYLETGKDEYVASLSFNSAMTYWAEFLTEMFSKAPELQSLTYVGVLDDQPALKVTTTRKEYDEHLSRTQETIASYAAITFAKLGLHKTDDKGARKDQEQQKTKIYKAALGYLPKDHVFVSPKLKLDK